MPRYICSTFPIAAYPRKGTITWTSSSRRRRKSLIAAYPRKGTITQDEQSNQEHFDCSLSPQGDDNIIIVIYMQSPFIAAYPRKGTITLCHCHY